VPQRTTLPRAPYWTYIKNNIKVDLKEIGCKVVDWIHIRPSDGPSLAQHVSSAPKEGRTFLDHIATNIF
jgi:hypothetical protein